MYRGQPGDPAPLHGGWEARAFSEMCNTPLRTVIEWGQYVVKQRCGQRRRLQAGAVYACPDCDQTEQWPIHG